MLSLKRRAAAALAAAADPGSVPVRRDPAPTRLAYRYHRLMLTPAVRLAVRIVLPVALILGIGTLWYRQNSAWIDAEVQALIAQVQNRPEFMVSGMEITGADRALTAAIEGLVTVEFPLSSWQLDLDEIRTGILALSAVEAATVRVRPGGILDISVTERRPVAVWRFTDGLRLIDAEGRMTGMIAARGDRADLPLIAGDGAKDVIDEALALFLAAAPIADRVRGLVRMGERRWDMVLDRDQRILLPEEDPLLALERVIALHEATDLLGRDVTVVDMRNGARPTLRLDRPALNVLRNVSTDVGPDVRN